MRTVTIGLLAVLWTAGAAFPAWGAEGEVSRVSGSQQEEPLAGLKRENELLREKLRQLEAKPSLTSEALSLKNYRRLQEIARDVKSQRQTMIEFEGLHFRTDKTAEDALKCIGQIDPDLKKRLAAAIPHVISTIDRHAPSPIPPSVA